MGEDSFKKQKYLILSRRFASRTPWLPLGFVASLTFMAILASMLTQPALGSAAEPLNETRVLPSPTTVQVTPPPKGTATGELPLDDTEIKDETSGAAGQWTQTQSRLLSFAGGILVWAVASITVLVLATLVFLYVRQRRRSVHGPLQISSVPFLKSNDGSLYFRLDRLNEDGLIIGRGTNGVDLRIKESTPFVDTVSNRHARIYFDTNYGNVIIEDLDSSNGIFINGRQAPRKNLLKDGWVVGLGSVTLTYRDGESDTGPLD